MKKEKNLYQIVKNNLKVLRKFFDTFFYDSSIYKNGYTAFLKAMVKSIKTGSKRPVIDYIYDKANCKDVISINEIDTKLYWFFKTANIKALRIRKTYKKIEDNIYQEPFKSFYMINNDLEVISNKSGVRLVPYQVFENLELPPSVIARSIDNLEYELGYMTIDYENYFIIGNNRDLQYLIDELKCLLHTDYNEIERYPYNYKDYEHLTSSSDKEIKKNSNLTFGIEVEYHLYDDVYIDENDGYDSIIGIEGYNDDIFEHFVAKYDGSLQNGGLEFVSNKLDYKKIKKLLKDLYSDFDNCYELFVDEGSGIHVHLSDNGGINYKNYYKLAAFYMVIYNLIKYLFDKENDYCEFHSEFIDSLRSYKFNDFFTDIVTYKDDHYFFISDRKNRFELRFFRHYNKQLIFPFIKFSYLFAIQNSYSYYFINNDRKIYNDFCSFVRKNTNKDNRLYKTIQAFIDKYLRVYNHFLTNRLENIKDMTINEKREFIKNEIHNDEIIDIIDKLDNKTIEYIANLKAKYFRIKSYKNSYVTEDDNCEEKIVLFKRYKYYKKTLEIIIDKNGKIKKEYWNC